MFLSSSSLHVYILVVLILFFFSVFLTMWKDLCEDQWWKQKVRLSWFVCGAWEKSEEWAEKKGEVLVIDFIIKCVVVLSMKTISL